MSNLNFETMTLEDLAKMQKDIAIQIEKKISHEVKQSRAQVEKLVATMGLKLATDKKPKKSKSEPKPEPVEAKKEPKPEDKWEAAKETLKEPVMYCHPEDETKTWNGQGRKPKWVKDLERDDWKLEDLKVKLEEAKEEPQPEEPKEEVKPEEEVKEGSAWPM